MQIELVVTRVKSPSYVELNDFSGYRVPGRVSLRTVNPVPVDQLPGATLNQYGHTTAVGSAQLHPEDAKRLFGHMPRRGDRIVVETAVAHRNRGMRRGGTFNCMGMHPVRKETP